MVAPQYVLATYFHPPPYLFQLVAGSLQTTDYGATDSPCGENQERTWLHWHRPLDNSNLTHSRWHLSLKYSLFEHRWVGRSRYILIALWWKQSLHILKVLTENTAPNGVVYMNPRTLRLSGTVNIPVQLSTTVFLKFVFLSSTNWRRDYLCPGYHRANRKTSLAGRRKPPRK